MGWTDEEIKALQEDGWDSDIESVERNEENLDGIQGKIVVKLDPEYKDQVVDAINKYVEENNIEVEVS